MVNFFQAANLSRNRNTYTVRQERIKREGSAYYTWVVPVTATTETSVIHVQTQFPQARKYEPLDWLEIVNNEAINALTLTINAGDAFPIMPGTIRTIDGHALWHIAVTNNGGVNTTLNNIIITMRRQPMTIDRWSQKQ